MNYYFLINNLVFLYYLSHYKQFYKYLLHHSHLYSNNRIRSYNKSVHGRECFLFCMVLDFSLPYSSHKYLFHIWSIYNLF